MKPDLNTNVPVAALRAINRRIGFLFLALVLAVAVIAIGARVLEARAQTKYFVSTALIDFGIPPIEFSNVQMESGAVIISHDGTNGLKRESVINVVVQQLKLAERLSASGKPLSDADAARILERTVIVKRREAQTFALSAFSKDRALAAEIANAVVAAYADERAKTGLHQQKADVAEMRKELDKQKAEVSRLYEAAAKLRKENPIEDTHPDEIVPIVSNSGTPESQERKYKINEYLEAKSTYIMARSLLQVIEQRYAAAKFDTRFGNAVFPPPVKILEPAQPETSDAPSHTLPSESIRFLGSAMQLLLVGLAGTAVGFGVAYLLLRGLVPWEG